MSLILAATTVEIDTLLWIAGILLGVIGFLTIVVAKHFNDRLNDISTENRNINTKIDTQNRDLEAKINDLGNKTDAKLEIIHKRVTDERTERANKHDDLARRVFDEVDKTKERCSDLSETVAGIGAVYVTRNEFNTIANRNNMPH